SGAPVDDSMRAAVTALARWSRGEDVRPPKIGVSSRGDDSSATGALASLLVMIGAGVEQRGGHHGAERAVPMLLKGAEAVLARAGEPPDGIAARIGPTRDALEAEYGRWRARHGLR